MREQENLSGLCSSSSLAGGGTEYSCGNRWSSKQSSDTIENPHSEMCLMFMQMRLDAVL